MTDDQQQRLEALTAAHERGEIDDATFEARKAELLGVTSSAPTVVSPLAPPPQVVWDEPLHSGIPAGVPSSHLAPPSSLYPLRYDVAYAEHLSRWKTLLRGFLLVPVWSFLYLLEGALFSLVAIGWTTVFWRKKYPAWAFQGTAGALAFLARATAYGLLQTDRFPSFDVETSPVTLEFDSPPSGHLSRWRVFFWKLTLLVPHFVVLSFLQLALFAVTVIAWFAILITGHYPRGMFPFATGVMRWHYRVAAYFFSFNDRFPPYSLSANAGPAGNGATIGSGVGGLVLAGGFTALIVTAAVLGSRSHIETVDYASLTKGQAPVFNEISTTGGLVVLKLNRAYDPGGDMAKLIRLAPGERIVVFEWEVINDASSAADVSRDAATFTASSGGHEHDYNAAIVTVENQGAPASFRAHGAGLIRAVFVVPADATAVSLRFHRGFAGIGGIEYKFD